jgi:hypothetical protein
MDDDYEAEPQKFSRWLPDRATQRRQSIRERAARSTTQRKVQITLAQSEVKPDANL